MMWWDHGGGGWWLVMPLVTVAFWAVIVWAVVTLVRGGPSAPRAGSPPRPAPEEILAERFARGDIDEDEYRRRLETLGGRASVGEQR
jgi:putative membrane protein